MKLAIGSDHAGFLLKKHIYHYLKDKNFDIVDFGTDSEESVDYPDYAQKVSRYVVENEDTLGILICGTGVGISISANKVKGVRCACVSESYSAEMSRRHNDANIIAFGARVVGADVAERIVDAFLSASFEGGRHEKRVKKMMLPEE